MTLFYGSLEPVEVIVPFAIEIAGFVNRNGALPISSRRAFKRVLATIKTIALVHQRQRSREEMGRVVADYADYALAYQLVGDSFREALGEGQRYTDDRIRLIEKTGPITPKGLSEKLGVSVPAVTQWMKSWMERGVLAWCDKNGNKFAEVAELEKAKRTGRAFVKVAGGCRLPTSYELTGDLRWDSEGEFWNFYDLGIETEDQFGVRSDFAGNDVDVLEERRDEISNPQVEGEDVKALSEKTGNDFDFSKSDYDLELVPEDRKSLPEEFGDLLRIL